mmetsp:Transcript_16265/g.32357  ORF Transcript_16265/g.32357 Transcript_16265/m.32357 type:complete len:155 (-) Transcript_16265:251-715(-)
MKISFSLTILALSSFVLADACDRIKLYWKKGYRWQKSSKEKKWCMSTSGSKVEIKKCSSSSRQKFKFISGNRIQSCRDKKKCFEMKGSSVKLEKCDSSKKQEFRKKGSSSKFKLEPKSRSGCLTQRHHPKSGEKVYAEKCRTAEKDDTVYWKKD